MSVHLPSLPSSAAWETPLNVSRDVLGAIGDVADSAAETAGHLIRPRRSTSRVRSIASSKWTVVVLVAIVALVVASIVRRSEVESDEVKDRDDTGNRDTGNGHTGDRHTGDREASVAGSVR